jgi:hypothetical protein
VFHFPWKWRQYAKQLIRKFGQILKIHRHPFGGRNSKMPTRNSPWIPVLKNGKCESRHEKIIAQKIMNKKE